MVLKKIQGIGVGLNFNNSTPFNVINLVGDVAMSTTDGVLTLTGTGVAEVSVSAGLIKDGDYIVSIADEKSQEETRLWAIDFLGDKHDFIIKD